MSRPRQTPSQTIGPFFHDGLMEVGVDDLDPEGAAGDRVRVEGRILDGDGEPVTDAMLEVWQADGVGRYRHPADGRAGDVPDDFVGFGRVATDADGAYAFATVAPGTVPGPDGTVQAPHLNVQLFARGLLNHLSTRIYFEGQPANDDDPVLAAVPEARRRTLVARRVDDGDDGDASRTYRFDIVLQGDDETVFFDV